MIPKSLMIPNCQVWKLSSCDMCELARNSVLQGGYQDAVSSIMKRGSMCLLCPLCLVYAETNIVQNSLIISSHFLRRRAIGWVQTGSERVLPATTSLAPTSQTSGSRTGHQRQTDFVILSVFPIEFFHVAGMRPSSRSCPSYSKASFKSEPCTRCILESCT